MSATRIQWGGVVCLARGFQFANATGTAPATGRVRLAVVDLGGRAVPQSGRLIFGEEGGRVVETQELWAAEVAREDDGQVVAVELVDARWWWADRGRPVTLRGRAPLEAQVGACLAALPGGWRARDMDLAQGRAQVLAEVVGAPALDVLDRLLALRQVVLAPRLDGEARIWAPGRGEVDEGLWSGAVAVDQRGQRLALNAGDAVEVTLPPPVYEASVDWCVPVVSVRWQGQTWVEDYDLELPARLRARLRALEGGEDDGRQGVEDAVSEFEESIRDDAARGWIFDGQRRTWRRVADGLDDLPPSARAAQAGGPDGLDDVLPPRVRLASQAERDAAAILSMPTAAPGQDPASYALGLPAGIVDQLQAQAGRLYRLPREFAHLAPILGRPAVSAAGDRLPVEVEAFAWTALASTYQVEDNAANQVLDDKREAAQLELQEVESRRARIRDRLRLLDEDEAKKLNAAGLLASAAVLDSDLATPTGFLQRLLTGWARTGSLSESAGEVRRSVESVGRALNDLKGSFGRFAIEGFMPDFPFYEDRLRGELERQLAELTARARTLAAVADPQYAARLRVEAATQAAADAYRSSGVVSEEAEAELAAARAAFAAAARARPARAMRPLVQPRLVNMPRATVEASVRPDGLIETAQPVGWLADVVTTQASASPWVYMPVRVTFGTRALPRTAPLPERRRELDASGLPLRPIMRAGAEALVRLLATPDAGFWVGSIGHEIPAVEGGPLTIREQRDGAQADTPAVQVVVEGPEWEVLVPRDGRRRTDEPIELRARALARQVLARPKVRSAGDVRLIGPWPVEVDGIVSRVAWASNEDGTVDTTVSFAPAQRPLAAWEAPEVRMGYVEGGA